MLIFVRHRVHVGWTANVGLETRTENVDALDPDLKQLLSVIGFDPNLKLRKKDIQKVYDAVNTIGGLEAVKNEVHQRQLSPPPVSQLKPQAGVVILCCFCFSGLFVKFFMLYPKLF